MSDENDPLRPVVLATFVDEMEASLLLTMLEQANIKAQMTGGAIAGFRIQTPAEVQVLIASVDVPAAKKVLADYQRDQQPVNWDEVDVGQPEEE